MDDDCDDTCQPDVWEHDMALYYSRTCQLCGFVWESSHCPHDGVQNPCRECGWVQEGTRTPLQFLGVVASPPQA